MRRHGMRNLTAGAIALVVVAIGCYFGFTKRNPFAGHYEVRAVVADANALKPNSPVRIAGVTVGKVHAVAPYKHTKYALITMRITDDGRPIHRDATFKVRPRLFLEGNFYVDLTPGTPSAPELADNGMLPLAAGSAPVQLDNVLTALDSGTRGSLQQVVKGLGTALDTPPTAAQDAQLPESVRGLTGGQALNKTLRTSPAALRGTAVVTEALRGPGPRDLSRTISGFARAAAALDSDDRALGGLVEEFAATMQTTAARSGDLRETIRRLGPTAGAAQRALASVDAALPPTRRFARDLAAGFDELPGTIRLARPWLRQNTQLFSQRELGGLLDDLQPAITSTAELVSRTNRFLPKIDDFNRCITGVILPTGNVKVDDGPLSTGVENYKEFWYAMVGQASEGQAFDGNGNLLRLQAVGGDNQISSGITNYVTPDFGPLFSNTTLRPGRTSPRFPGQLPPVRTDVACRTQGVPDVNGPNATGPADGSKPGAASPKPPPRIGAGG